MRVPHVVAQPAQVLRILGRSAVEFFAAVGDVVVVFRQMGVQAHLVAARQRGRLTHQVAADGKGRAGRQRHLDHRAEGVVVVGLDHPARVLQYVGLVLDHRVRRQAALRLAHTHAATAGGEAHADFLCRFDAVLEPHAVGVDVQVVAAGGAAAQQQLGHGHLGRHAHHLGRQAGPDRIQAAQPAEQLGVLHRRNRPGERLEHVVVRVDQARRDEVVARIDHLVGVLRKAVGRPDGLDAIAPDQDRRVAQFTRLHRVGVVEGRDAARVPDQQGVGSVVTGVQDSVP